MNVSFVTGTDTGVGKTVLTSHWLFGLRQQGVDALAMKPFCSGNRQDVRQLQRLQKGCLTDEECNPYFFQKPLAPAVAAREEGRRIRWPAVVTKVGEVARRCERLLVEGAGGLLVPLSGRKTVLDLILQLRVKGVVVVSANRLGTINHTLMTVRLLRSSGVKNVRVVLMNTSMRERDASKRTNGTVLKDYLGKRTVVECPGLGLQPVHLESLKKRSHFFQKVLAEI